MKSCESCMQTTTVTERQLLRCGREAPAAPELATRICHLPSWSSVEPISECPGHLVSLPQVIEGTRARMWRSDLPAFTQPHTHTEALVRAAELAENAHNEVAHWNATPYEEGGGLPPRPT